MVEGSMPAPVSRIYGVENMNKGFEMYGAIKRTFELSASTVSVAENSNLKVPSLDLTLNNCRFIR